MKSAAVTVWIFVVIIARWTINVKAVIFDMDGVLINSEPLYIEMLKDFFTRHQIVFAEAALTAVIGSSHERVREIVHDIWIQSKDEASFQKHYHEYENGEEIIPYQNLLNPHVLELLKWLRDRSIQMAIASSSPLQDIKEMLRQCELKTYFDVIHSGHECEASKPDPAVYQKTMDDLGVSAKDCLIVEDSFQGIAAAKAAHAFCAALKTSYPMDQRQADVIIDDLLQIQALIR